MPRRTLMLSLGVTACLVLLVFGVEASRYDDEENHGPTVKVSVQAADTSPGGVLHYRWRSTDGQITDVNAPTTTWALPAGPGLHFAYVLVSNGLGGYTERRIAVNTDTIGTKIESETQPMALIAPQDPAQQGDYYRSFVAWGATGTEQSPPPGAVMHDVYAPNVAVYLSDQNGVHYPATGTVFTDLKGQFIIPGVPAGKVLTANCSVAGISFTCTPDAGATMVTDPSGLPLATTDYIVSPQLNTGAPISGTFILEDGGPCGTINEFFGVSVTATATLLDASTPPKVLAGPASVNEFGDYSLPFEPGADHVLLKCENAGPVSVTIGSALNNNGNATDLSKTVLPGVKAPTVSNMTATLNGQPLTSAVAPFLPPPTEFPDDHKFLPSNILDRADGYLADKGVDTRRGACRYYKAIGAVQGCSAAGNLIGAISFNDWKRAVKIGQYATGGVPTFSASYINKVDLNLARVHQSISYGPGQTAAVVCNHLGIPLTTSIRFLNPLQSEINTVVDNEVQGKNLVACVAMDINVNNHQPFIRFLIFGPSGQLLPSINLDGRREKFVPGTCVVCHGGDHYAGKFPEDGSGLADVGAHFLPYDVGNFEFSSKPGLTRCDQEEAIYHLNQNVLYANPTEAELELIAGQTSTGTAVPGWYTKGVSQCSTKFVHVLDESFVPKSWQDANSQNPSAGIKSFYQNVNARSCRTCHVAMIEGYNFDHYANLTNTNINRFSDVGFDTGINICGGSFKFERDHMMPNSLVTFNRFWLSADPDANPTGPNHLPNQLELTSSFFLATSGDFGSFAAHPPCPTPGGTTP